MCVQVIPKRRCFCMRILHPLFNRPPKTFFAVYQRTRVFIRTLISNIPQKQKHCIGRGFKGIVNSWTEPPREPRVMGHFIFIVCLFRKWPKMEWQDRTTSSHAPHGYSGIGGSDLFNLWSTPFWEPLRSLKAVSATLIWQLIQPTTITCMVPNLPYFFVSESSTYRLTEANMRVPW